MSLIRRTRGTPEPNDFDRFLNVIKSALTVVGGVGVAGHPALAAAFPIAAEALNQVQAAVANRRSKQLVEEVVEDLYFAQKDRQLTDEQIQQIISSEQFHSALLQARLIATRTHQEEKLEALRAAVLNVALGKEPDADRQQQFLSLVDRYTALHLSLLRYLADPPGYLRLSGREFPLSSLGGDIIAVDHLVQIASGETPRVVMQHQETATSQFVAGIVEDLSAARLIHLHRIGDQWVMLHTSGPRPELSSATTQLGKDFLRFITEPGGANGN